MKIYLILTIILFVFVCWLRTVPRQNKDYGCTGSDYIIMQNGAILYCGDKPSGHFN